MRTATAFGAMALFLAGAGSAAAQDLVSTAGRPYSYPVFTGSATSLAEATVRPEEASAKRQTMRHFRKKVLDLLPDHMPFERTMERLPILASAPHAAESGDTWFVGPRLKSNLGDDAKLAAGLEAHLQRSFGGRKDRTFEAFAVIESLALAEDILEGQDLNTGHSLRTGVRLSLSGLNLTYDYMLNGGAGIKVEGASRQEARLTYALSF